MSLGCFVDSSDGCKHMPNIRGKAYAMNVITPMKRWKTPVLKLGFWIFSFKFTQWELRRLSFIHFARWTAIAPGDWPYFSSEMQSRENVRRDYLLFESNFNGSWNEYVDAFHAVLHFKLNLVWRWSDNYPGSIPLTGFKDYIEHNQKVTDWYYMAYPGSTVSDVKNALDVLDAFEKISASTELDDDDFDRAYLEFLGNTQNKLSRNGGPGPEMY